MRVLVTGGSGKLGRAVASDLLEHGHRVLSADLVPPPDGPGDHVSIDLQDLGQVMEVMGGIDLHEPVEGVAHLAAIPAPGRTSNAATFKNNILSTYNVFEAARRLGVRNVVYASTEIIFGLPFEEPPAYLPVDEHSPPRPESAYGLAKWLSELMAEQFARWDPTTKLVGLRFSNIQEPTDYARFPSFQDDPYLRRWNLWGYIDARDGAQAVRKALTSPLRGAEVFTIASAETVQRTPNAELVGHCFPGVALPGRLGPNETLLSIDKARRILGFEPEHHWVDELGG